MAQLTYEQKYQMLTQHGYEIERIGTYLRCAHYTEMGWIDKWVYDAPGYSDFKDVVNQSYDIVFNGNK